MEKEQAVSQANALIQKHAQENIFFDESHGDVRSATFKKRSANEGLNLAQYLVDKTANLVRKKVALSVPDNPVNNADRQASESRAASGAASRSGSESETKEEDDGGPGSEKNVATDDDRRPEAGSSAISRKKGKALSGLDLLDVEAAEAEDSFSTQQLSDEERSDNHSDDGYVRGASLHSTVILSDEERLENEKERFSRYFDELSHSKVKDIFLAMMSESSGSRSKESVQNTKGSSTVSKNLKKRKVSKRVVSSESRSRSPSPEHRRPLTKGHLNLSPPHKTKGKGKGKETKDRKPKI